VTIDLNTVSAATLAGLFAIEQEAAPLWTPGELSQILHHWLALPVEQWLGLSPKTDLTTISDLRTSVQPPIHSLRSLLEHPAPPINLLRQTKDFAKLCRDQAEHGIPVEVALVIYFACMARALLAHQTTITTMENGPAIAGLQWLESMDFADSSLRTIAHAALVQMGTQTEAR